MFRLLLSPVHSNAVKCISKLSRFLMQYYNTANCSMRLIKCFFFFSLYPSFTYTTQMSSVENFRWFKTLPLQRYINCVQHFKKKSIKTFISPVYIYQFFLTDMYRIKLSKLKSYFYEFILLWILQSKIEKQLGRVFWAGNYDWKYHLADWMVIFEQ